MSGGADSTRAVVYALGANCAIAVSKYAAAAITGSGSMFAEAVHSTADCGNQALLLLGLKRARRPASADHPFGFGRETYFWSFIVALLLFGVGGVFSIYEGLHKLHDPEPLTLPLLALGVLGFGMVAESFSMWGCLREVKKERGDRPLWSWFRHSRNAELVVIFGEDLAALLGLAFAFVAVLATWITGNPLWDALGGLVIGVLLIVVAILIAIEVHALLIGQGVDAAVAADMKAFLASQSQVETVFNLLTLHMGSDVMVAAKIKMREQGTQDALIGAINAIERAFKERFPQTRWIFFEPDVEA
jgi:cation diffusion facilitator family transporter